jgi:hypothetical protein
LFVALLVSDPISTLGTIGGGGGGGTAAGIFGLDIHIYESPSSSLRFDNSLSTNALCPASNQISLSDLLMSVLLRVLLG